MTDVLKIAAGPPQKFVAPDWPTFLEKRWTQWALERKGEVGVKDAFYAGWQACLEELGQTPRRNPDRG